MKKTLYVAHRRYNDLKKDIPKLIRETFSELASRSVPAGVLTV